MRYLFKRSCTLIAVAIRWCPRISVRSDRKIARPTTNIAIATTTLSAIWPQFGVGASMRAQRHPVMTPVIGLTDRSHCHFSGILLSEYGTADTKRQDRDQRAEGGTERRGTAR